MLYTNCIPLEPPSYQRPLSVSSPALKAVESAVATSKVRAILDAFQPGELGADAIMQMLVGETSPSGLMPYVIALVLLLWILSVCMILS